MVELTKLQFDLGGYVVDGKEVTHAKELNTTRAYCSDGNETY